ncbi:ABC transporter permease [Campylobacter geochelonis]|uniref:ABC-type multidrug transport system permease component n=1 Tax=Campylobacter geochelonis TaxID=1780362 RepID=A0A128EHI4_9BACT|nr:ABC transporter permease [Campylobacter geochelonis]QKF71114.1 multidrug resistance ABC transporter, permease protein [Campylobacter geochelonis]CZE48294.1 ABC-type multidrug transport system permease component [Campylobacter geochelonis]CZE48921.1 ABC-type multidrug transport system permease component [Campylobacter geochelonis]CZE50065.1 ABC-type multidrug transport system permease component [Campylobacter geochelonis]
MRLLALIKKELLTIKNDKRNLFLVFGAPLIQLLLFAFSINLDVKNINLAVFNQSGGEKSFEILRKFDGSNYIKSVKLVKSYDEGARLIDTQEVIALVVLPPNFGKTSQKIQLILDGRRSNSAQITQGYIASMLNSEPSLIEARNLYNPNLNNFWWILPNIFGSITLVTSVVLTAMSVARERELGTFDQILVSPLTPLEIMLGKLLPALLISIFISSIILFITFFIFKVPLVGSLWLLYLGVVIFLFSICGIGLFISSVANTQQQAILYSFVFLLPSFLLSGFATPVENMPSWLEPATDFVPLKYYIVFLRSVFLKDISFMQSLEYLAPMFALGVISFFVAMLFFKRRNG